MTEFTCSSSRFQEGETARYVTDADKLRIRSKFMLGSCAVHIVFLSGLSNRWDAARRSRMVSEIKNGLATLSTFTYQADGTTRLPALRFDFGSGDEESYSGSYDPLATAKVNDEIQRNVKQYLNDKGYPAGDVHSWQPEWEDAKVLQALYDFTNDQRDRANTDWAFVVFVVSNPNYASNGIEIAWASEKLGVAVVTETTRGDVSWVVAHEAGHLFGALDEYQTAAACPTWVGGMYKVVNANCQQPAGHACFMGYRGNATVCDVTVRQLGLQRKASGQYEAASDLSRNDYSLGDAEFKSQSGMLLRKDVVRAGRQLWVSIAGSAKMAGLYQPHGPEGDVNTIVGPDHLLAGHPFGGVIGRWVSLDGSRVTDWFYIGAGGRWITAPFRGCLVLAVNDMKGWFFDNSGAMSVATFVRLVDQLGAPHRERIAGYALVDAESTRVVRVDDAPLELRASMDPMVATEAA